MRETVTAMTTWIFENREMIKKELLDHTGVKYIHEVQFTALDVGFLINTSDGMKIIGVSWDRLMAVYFRAKNDATNDKHKEM